MTSRTHDTAAVLSLGIVALVVQPTGMNLATVLVAVLANQIGGVAPDIDQPTAPFWRNLPIGRLFGKLFGQLVGGHRFLSHSILGLALFGGLAYGLLSFLQPVMPHVQIEVVWWAFLIGMASHLIMDSFTREGVPWLLPVPVKFGFPPLRRWRVVTGSWLERAVIFPGLLVLLVWFCAEHYGWLSGLVVR